MATAADHNDQSVTETSSAMRNSQMANYPKNRFATFDDTDDHDDSGGGVMLRDFEDDSHSGSALTPMGTNSSISSGNGRATHPPRTKPATVTFATPTTLGRRNAIAPIGTGRYSERTTNANDGDALLDASVNAWMNAKPATANEAVQKNESVTQMHYMAPTTFAPSTSHIETPDQAFRAGYKQASNTAVNMNTPTATRGAIQYSQSATVPGYPWGTTPGAYNSAGITYNTPQSAGYSAAHGTAPGAKFPFGTSGMTPSHMPKNMATPQSASVYSQYNQTEPRNFAPRTGAAPMFMPPPPVFNLSRQQAAKDHENSQAIDYEESQTMGQGSDPFLSPTPKGANVHTISQALVLPSVPEHNQLPLIPYQESYGPVPAEIRAVRSTQLNKLTEGPMGLPTEDVALDSQNFPFIESTIQAAPVGHGVVKIRNIPFGTKRAEIIAFLGRNSKILNDNQEPVHIIMERVSSKTQDCYVEFMTAQDAVRAVDRHRDNVQRGRPSRLGERPVEVLLSSQAALMQDLFPLAAGVWWDNGKPIIQAPIDGQPWKTFKGFVTEEEMTMLVKHVEIPQRSPYSKECPQRPYECMISTIKKLPWYMSDRITLRQRHSIYEATVKLIGLLKQALQRNDRNHETMLNGQLMKRLVTAAMLCPGFSVVQKDNMAVHAEMDQDRARMFNQPRFAEQWVHLHGICPKPGTPLDVLEWYIAIIREETTRYIHRNHIVERNEIQRTSCYTSLYLGYFWYEVGLPTGKELDNLSLHAVARRELATIERAFRRALPAKEDTESN